MPNNNNFVGRVYYYISNWLKENKNGVKEPHYTPIVLEDGKHTVFIVIISSYKIKNEYIYHTNKDFYVVLEKEEYIELTEKSIIHCQPYQEQLAVFSNVNRKPDLPKVLLEKIIKGIKSNNNLQEWIKKSFRNVYTPH